MKKLALNKTSAMLQYKFYFAFESSWHCRDYITEKTWSNSLKLYVLEYIKSTLAMLFVIGILNCPSNQVTYVLQDLFFSLQVVELSTLMKPKVTYHIRLNNMSYFDHFKGPCAGYMGSNEGRCSSSVATTFVYPRRELQNTRRVGQVLNVPR